MAVLNIKRFDAVPARVNVWIMLFTCCWVAYMLRVNMSLNLIAMVPRAAGIGNATLQSACGPRRSAKSAREWKGITFDWSAQKQGLILSSYFWSYTISSVLGGTAAERWGPRYVILTTTVLSGVLTALSPLAARWSYIALVVIRLILGFAGGFTYPACHAMIARWAPVAEKGKFIAAMMGGTMGTVTTWSVTGLLMEKYGWESAFYVPAAITFVWSLIWWYLIANTPAEHPRISEAEKNYIVNSLGDKVNKSQGLPPYKKIVLSVPFLAMIVLHYGNLWGLYFVMTAGPKFMSEVLGFELSSAGAVSSLPYLARLCFAVIFGFIGDFIQSRNYMSTTMVRKTFCIFSHIIPGSLLILLVYVGCSPVLSVTLITFSMGSNGAAALTNLQNHQDLAPNYAGTLYGIANAIGSTAGFITPLITAHFTKSGNSFEQWRPVFYVGASVYIIAAVIFILLGTGKTQPWNYPEGTEPQEANTGDLKDMNAATKSADVKTKNKETPMNASPK